MEKIPVVNEEDNIIEIKERTELIPDDIYRVSALWVLDENKEILLARRAWTKKKDPGMWGPAVAGTVGENETYESNIIKEAEEELGLKHLNIRKGPKQRVKSPHNHFTQWFFSKIKKETPINIDNMEVAEIKWFKEEELLKLIENSPSEVIHSVKEFIKII